MSGKNGKWLFAAGMAVLPECRRQGIGYKLVQHREDWAQKLGATYARVGTSDRAPKPKAFHHRCGYKDWYYCWLGGRSYIQIYMRKDFGGAVSHSQTVDLPVLFLASHTRHPHAHGRTALVVQTQDETAGEGFLRKDIKDIKDMEGLSGSAGIYAGQAWTPVSP